MSHRRNTEGLAIAARNRRQSTIKRVNTAIHSLATEKKVINFNSVAKAANVGKTWLYKETEIKEKILSYRDKNIEVKISNKPASSSESKDALLRMLKERIKQLETENHELKKKIEVLYGKILKN